MASGRIWNPRLVSQRIRRAVSWIAAISIAGTVAGAVAPPANAVTPSESVANSVSATVDTTAVTQIRDAVDTPDWTSSKTYFGGSIQPAAFWVGGGSGGTWYDISPDKTPIGTVPGPFSSYQYSQVKSGSSLTGVVPGDKWLWVQTPYNFGVFGDNAIASLNLYRSNYTYPFPYLSTYATQTANKICGSGSDVCVTIDENLLFVGDQAFTPGTPFDFARAVSSTIAPWGGEVTIIPTSGSTVQLAAVVTFGYPTGGRTLTTNPLVTIPANVFDPWQERESTSSAVSTIDTVAAPWVNNTTHTAWDGAKYQTVETSFIGNRTVTDYDSITRTRTVVNNRSCDGVADVYLNLQKPWPTSGGNFTNSYQLTASMGGSSVTRTVAQLLTAQTGTRADGVLVLPNVPIAANSSKPLTITLDVLPNDIAVGSIATSNALRGEFDVTVKMSGYNCTSDVPLPLPDVDPDQHDGTIIVTKLANPETVDHQATGAADLAAYGDPLPGVSFEVCRVTAGGGTTLPVAGPYVYEWWEVATQLSTTFNAGALLPAFPPPDPENYLRGPYSVDNCRTGTTDADGTIKYPGLPLGLYLVREFDGPAGYLPADPFLITLPLISNDGSGWIVDGGEYVAWVYPKNPQPSVAKEATDVSMTNAIGSPIGYTITAPVPCIPGTGSGGTTSCIVTDLVITDTLGAGLAWTNPSTHTWDPPTVQVVGGGGSPTIGLVKDTDYEVTSSGSVMEITFTPDGLDVLQANVTGQVIVGVTAYVQSILTVTGTDSAVNNVSVGWNHYPDLATAQAYVNFGGVTIHKYNAAEGVTAPISGATFRVFADSTAAGTWTPSATSGWLAATNQFGAEVDEFTTDSSGVASILGLFYTDNSSDPRTCTDTGGHNGTQYWILETVVPNGYTGTSTPIPVCVTGPVDSDPNTVDDEWVSNVPTNAGFPLPFTGDQLRDYKVQIGLVVMVAGLVGFVARTKKLASNQEMSQARATMRR